MKIRYVGELLETTGYGEAARLNVALLHRSGHEVQCVPTGAQSTSESNWKYQLVTKLLNFDKSIKPDIVIAHIYPPKELKRYKIAGVPLISYIAWETDLLPALWASNLNAYADYVITTCKEMQEVFVRSGVIKPVFVLGPTIFDEDLQQSISQNTKLDFLENDNSFKFYSIFQWIERKDPRKLVSAFIQEFDNIENVSLVLKTYRLNHSKQECDILVNEIRNITTECGVISPPTVRIIPNVLSMDQLQLLHQSCQCFVSPHRGEGTGLGICDAILAKKRIITTEYGGPQDFLGHHAIKLKYKMIPIQNPIWCFNYFNSYMNWADVDIIDLRRQMRRVYLERNVSYSSNLEHDRNYLLSVYGEDSNRNTIGQILASTNYNI